METADPVLLGASYVLGARQMSYLDIEGFAATAASYQMAEDPSLWGWGKFHKSDDAAIEMTIETAQRTLRRSGLHGSDIDTLIMCATEFPAGIDSHAACTRRLIDALALGDVFVVGVTLNRCATLLSALVMANALVRSGERRAILVVSGDKIDSESQRFQKFAIFSDGAASCVVAAGGSTGYAILAGATAVEAAAMRVDGEISSRLGREVNERIRRLVDVAPAQIRLVLHNNMFIPLVRMKEQNAGFRPSQLYLDNVARKGHCFGCDPLINLVDCASSGLSGMDDYLLLASSTPGMRATVLLRQI